MPPPKERSRSVREACSPPHVGPAIVEAPSAAGRQPCAGVSLFLDETGSREQGRVDEGNECHRDRVRRLVQLGERQSSLGWAWGPAPRLIPASQNFHPSSRKPGAARLSGTSINESNSQDSGRVE